jgi:hypothetical protein
MMTYAEYLGWQEYYAIEPFGLAVQDAAQAHITSTLANVNRDSAKRPDAYRIDEFLLYERREPVAESGILLDDVEAQSELMKQVLFGKDKNV